MDHSTEDSSTFFTLPFIINTSATKPILDASHFKQYLSWYDYILFGLMLLVSALIGIYFGFFGKKQSTSKEYLMGGKEMKVIPIAISLVASHISGITLMAVPADVYVFGATYWLGVISMMILAFITVYVYLPVFYNLEITSTYEYLGMRFDERCRKCASGLFALSVFVFLPMVIYVPALAFAAVTGINVHVITPIICGICIFYTTIGGLKAVVWTDAIQFTVTVGAALAVFFLGLKSAGGFAQVWKTSLEGDRLNVFDLDPDMTKRETVWAIVIGLTVHWVAHTAINQSCTQKFMAVPTYSHAVKTVFYYCIGMSFMKSISVFTGLIMFTMYAQCDPMTTKQIEKKDQLLPFYVLDVAGHIPGLSGLFIAGLFSAALSTLSANLNSLSGTIYEDFLKIWLEKHGNHKTAGSILKLIVVVTGVLSTVMVFVAEHLGGLFALSISLGSVAHGPLLGLFTLGVLFPRANAKGAFWGALSAMSFMAVIISGARYYTAQGLFKYHHKPVSVDGCASLGINVTNLLGTETLPQITNQVEPFFLFRLSFYWYTMIGAIVTIVIGLIISYSTSKNNPPVDKKLISPVIHFLLPKDEKIEMGSVKANADYDYYTVQQAIEKVVVENGYNDAKEH